MRTLASLGALIAVALSVASLATARSVASDPPTLALWHEVGPFGLGEARARIEYDFGPRRQISGNAVMSGPGYRLHGGVVLVFYDSANHVRELNVSTPYYVAQNGFRVGYKIPLGSCHRVKGECVYRWHGLTYSSLLGEWQGQFVQQKARISVMVQTTRGVVASFSMAKLGTAGRALTPSTAAKAAIIAAVKATSASGCTAASCHVTNVKLAGSNPSYALVAIYDPNIGGAVLILHRVAGQWRIAAGPGTSDVGCGTVSAQVLGDFGLTCGG